ncbi:threonine synthase [Fulvimarina pelagi HTCC2506]|uniref:Threonine synthase n=2 Tax=Fulvimarina pelagi TaxID=217511 RepID=Q0G178_9HYPH|nr:threonine synthase [Fulvimarina pelagi]EAU41203.1 threonine synthase [Fulvimarina pelagi HTCC2506]BAT30786.1 threonine synthase [Fulvimarina pelagi]
MEYVSTRGEAPRLGFADTLLAGLAGDGGLYVPNAWPQLSQETIRSFRGRPYSEIAYEVMAPFVGEDIAADDLKSMIDDAYATFPHPAVAPLVQIGANHFLLELFHGPTLAFKDVAMQLLARLMDHVLAERGQRATIVGATSGDTGGAAIAAFAGSERADIFILFPNGRVSPVQQRQMTTSGSANVHAVSLDGTFDDCQALVKAMFNDRRFRADVGLSGVNSINWGRIMAQIVYYFTAAASLGAPDRQVSFTVPTGNFGDIFAGFAAKRMGLPIDRLIVATNANDILDRTLKTGRYETDGVEATMSPSMDIQVSSNFERLIFEASGRDADLVRGLMQQLSQSGAFTLPNTVIETIRNEFDAGRTDEAETARTIKNVLTRQAYLLDPHTAVAVNVAEALLGEAPMVTLSTAHPAKFPDAVTQACGRTPDLPPSHADLMQKRERFDTIANDLDALQQFIRERSRAGNGAEAA